MSKIKRDIIFPTPEEDAKIRAGIAADPDARELTTEEIARMRSVSEFAPHLIERHRPSRGKQETPGKVPVTIRLDADLVERLRATGRGWQTRLNDTLRDVVLGAGK